MKEKDVQIGQTYRVKVSGSIANVQILRESPYGGWEGVNTRTQRAVRIRSAQRLRAVASALNQEPKERVVDLGDGRIIRVRGTAPILYWRFLNETPGSVYNGWLLASYDMIRDIQEADARPKTPLEAGDIETVEPMPEK